MFLTVAELGVLFLILFGVLHWLGIFANTRAILAFLGAVIVGTTGFLGHILASVGSWAQNTFGSVTNWALGVPLAAGLFIVLAIIFIHDVHPKNQAGKRTGWIGLALGVLVAIGVAGIPALAGLHGAIMTLLGNAQTALGGL